MKKVNPIDILRKQIKDKELIRTKELLIEMQPQWVTDRQDQMLEHLR